MVLTSSDGNGSLFGTLSGNTREVVHKFTVDLPKKHGRGGQSALRFSRLREEARRNYVRKVAELAVQHFITADKVNVAGLVLAGSAELKTDLSGSDLFDPRLLAKVVKVVDVSYGGENGFNQVSRSARVNGFRLTGPGYRTRRGLAGQCQVRSGEASHPEIL